MRWRNSRLLRLATAVAWALIGAYMLLMALGQLDPLNPLGQALTASGNDPVLTTARLAHITDGDARGGGHLAGTGAPCKSEFPASWTRETIAREIPRLAANDNLEWRQGHNSYVTAQTPTADGLVVRIVVDPANNEIITAYPVNVARNPCPANDNQRR